MYEQNDIFQYPSDLERAVLAHNKMALVHLNIKRNCEPHLNYVGDGGGVGVGGGVGGGGGGDGGGGSCVFWCYICVLGTQ